MYEIEAKQTGEYISPARHYIDTGGIFYGYEPFDHKTKPLPYKLYEDAPCIPLDYEWQHTDSAVLTPPRLGHMLAQTYGITRQRWISVDTYNVLTAGKNMPQLDQSEKAFNFEFLRSVPSGGGLFPCELYVVVGANHALNEGIYHYDALHHVLDIVALGTFLPGVQNACLLDSASPASFAVVLSCLFGKNAYAYGETSYRLQSLDLGVVLAQCLEVFQHYRYQGRVHYQFLDRIINDLLGFDSLYESTYGVLLFEQKPQLCSTSLIAQQAQEQNVSSVCSSYNGFKPLSTYPLLESLHQAALCTDLRQFTNKKVPQPSSPCDEVHISVSSDRQLPLLDAIYSRHSAVNYFQPGMLQEWQVAQLLHKACNSYKNDIEEDVSYIQHVLLYCVVNDVDGMMDGVYCYKPCEQALVIRHGENVRAELQQVLGYINTYHLNVHFFLVGSYEPGLQAMGDRWYRIQNMEAGIVLQRLYLTAAALNLGCQASIAYSVKGIDTFLDLPSEMSTLAHLMVGPEGVNGQYYVQPTVCFTEKERS